MSGASKDVGGASGPSKVAYVATDRCRICGGTELVPVVHLGDQCLTGVFPRAKGLDVTRGPLELVRCAGDPEAACGLVQLRHTYEPTEMYGANYGYRSSLNRSMIEHLRAKVAILVARAPIGPGDAVLDIGSNDGTTLSCYRGDAALIGIDPTAAKFAEYYPPHVKVVPEFFSAAAFDRASGGKKAKIVTSIAMFYDLERPMDFARQVADVLADDGIWHFEQSYLPSMLDASSYDTICHEHIEYYSLRQIRWMTDRLGLSIVDVVFNDVNGGSFAVTVAKSRSGIAPSPKVEAMLRAEADAGLGGAAPYARFAADVARRRDELVALLADLRRSGKKVLGLGASTKGNVILQYCGLTAAELPYIAEVNVEKFGAFTPGTEIPIISEDEARALAPDHYLVLPWHFRTNLLLRHAAFVESGGKMIFPLPRVDVVPP